LDIHERELTLGLAVASAAMLLAVHTLLGHAMQYVSIVEKGPHTSRGRAGE